MDPSSWFSGNGDIGSEVLWEDAERLLCRRWRPCANGDRQSVLVVLPIVEHPTPGSLNRLTHEFEVKDDLDDAWAARPLELMRERGQTILVLKDPGASRLTALSVHAWRLEHSCPLRSPYPPLGGYIKVVSFTAILSRPISLSIP